MTKGTIVFRIIISVLLGITMLCSLFFAALSALYISKVVMAEELGVSVAGVEVTRSNKDDVLGDGTVSFDAYNKVLDFHNAQIKYDDTVVYSRIDLMIRLTGENKFLMSGTSVPAIYAGNARLMKDLAFLGEGSLTIEFENNCSDAMGIYARNLRFETDVTVTTPDCANIVNGICSEANMTVTNQATVTVHNGAGKYSTAVKSCNNINIETGSTMNVSVASGTTDICKAFQVLGSLILWDDAVLNVSMDDETAQTSECIHVTGFMSVGRNAAVTASAKNTYAIKCCGSMELSEGASVSASADAQPVDLMCYGAIVNNGATLHAETETFAGAQGK